VLLFYKDEPNNGRVRGYDVAETVTFELFFLNVENKAGFMILGPENWQIIFLQ
jgi:hypothetical protein